VPILWLQGPQESETASCEAREGKIEAANASSLQEQAIPPVYVACSVGTISSFRKLLGDLTQGRSSQVKAPKEASAAFASEEGEVRYPANLRWICVRCTNSCRDLLGRRRNILLTPNDIKRITDAAKLTAQEFSISSRSPVPYNRMMKKRGGRCFFLQGSRCSIYGARPLVCRFYPFFLRPAGDDAFEIGFDPSCSGMGKGPQRGERFFHSLLGLAKRELNKL
jgi:Fe-S-cluster containining protein